MAWAQSLWARNGDLLANIADGSDSRDIPLAELASIGVPIEWTHRTNSLDTDFADWHPVEPKDYLDAFGVSVLDVGSTRHAVYETNAGDTRIVAPALALIRGLCAPSRHFIPAVFAPQVLDRLTRIDWATQPPSICFDIRESEYMMRSRYSDMTPVFAWMWSHCSAHEMVHSIHAHAMLGRLDLTLPRARARIAVHGLRRGNSFFVSRLFVLSIQPTERPLPIYRQTSELYRYRGTSADTEAPRRISISDYAHIPKKADGSICVSDDEWAQIAPLLESDSARSRIVLDQRAILDALLTKLATGAPWRRIPCRQGNHHNIQYAFRAWAVDGRLARVIEILARTRPMPSH